MYHALTEGASPQRIAEADKTDCLVRNLVSLSTIYDLKIPYGDLISSLALRALLLFSRRAGSHDMMIIFTLEFILHPNPPSRALNVNQVLNSILEYVKLYGGDWRDAAMRKEWERIYWDRQDPQYELARCMQVLAGIASDLVEVYVHESLPSLVLGYDLNGAPNSSDGNIRSGQGKQISNSSAGKKDDSGDVQTTKSKKSKSKTQKKNANVASYASSSYDEERQQSISEDLTKLKVENVNNQIDKTTVHERDLHDPALDISLAATTMSTEQKGVEVPRTPAKSMQANAPNSTSSNDSKVYSDIESNSSTSAA